MKMRPGLHRAWCKNRRSHRFVRTPEEAHLQHRVWSDYNRPHDLKITDTIEMRRGQARRVIRVSLNGKVRTHVVQDNDQEMIERQIDKMVEEVNAQPAKRTVDVEREKKIGMSKSTKSRLDWLDQ